MPIPLSNMALLLSGGRCGAGVLLDYFKAVEGENESSRAAADALLGAFGCWSASNHFASFFLGLRYSDLAVCA